MNLEQLKTSTSIWKKNFIGKVTFDQKNQRIQAEFTHNIKLKHYSLRIITKELQSISENSFLTTAQQLYEELLQNQNIQILDNGSLVLQICPKYKKKNGKFNIVLALKQKKYVTQEENQLIISKNIIEMRKMYEYKLNFFERKNFLLAFIPNENSNQQYIYDSQNLILKNNSRRQLNFISNQTPIFENTVNILKFKIRQLQKNSQIYLGLSSIKNISNKNMDIRSKLQVIYGFGKSQTVANGEIKQKQGVQYLLSVGSIIKMMVIPDREETKLKWYHNDEYLCGQIVPLEIMQSEMIPIIVFTKTIYSIQILVDQ